MSRWGCNGGHGGHGVCVELCEPQTQSRRLKEVFSIPAVAAGLRAVVYIIINSSQDMIISAKGQVIPCPLCCISLDPHATQRRDTMYVYRVRVHASSLDCWGVQKTRQRDA